MARAIFHLLDTGEPCGTYNLTCSGELASWADIARRVFDLRNGNGGAVRPVSTAEYYAAAEGPVAPRPEHSVLDLAKIGETGYAAPDWVDRLESYMGTL